MGGKEIKHKAADWGSGQFFLPAEDNELEMRFIIGFVLGPSEIDDRYVVDFYFRKTLAGQKDNTRDEIKFHMNFENWDEVVYWLHTVALKVSPMLFVKNEWGMEYVVTDSKTFDRVSSCIGHIASQLEDVRTHIQNSRTDPDSPENMINKSELH